MAWKYEPDDNGLYPAVPDPENPDMKYYWIRDNYWIWKATREKSIPEAFAEIVDNHAVEIRHTAMADDPADYHHIHPRYDENLEEIEGDWGWLQWDSVGNLLEVLSYATNSDEYGDYSREADIVANYIDSFDFHVIPDHGMWEDGKDINPSSIAAVIRGFLEYGRSFEHPKLVEWREQMIRYMPQKNLSAATCLHLADEVIPPYMKRLQIQHLEDLERDHGLIRYPGDRWDGEKWREGEEPQWVIGLGFMYLLTGERKYWERLKKLKKEYGELPESFIDGEPNGNQPLIWSEAMYELCRREAEAGNGPKISYRQKQETQEKPWQD